MKNLNMLKQARKGVAVAAIGWLLHIGILVMVMEIGTGESYYGYGTTWRPDWPTIALLLAVTLPFVVPYLIRPTKRRRSYLIVPALAHLPFIHFGLILSLIYLTSIKMANRDYLTSRQGHASIAVH